MTCPVSCGFLFISLITGCREWGGLNVGGKWESHFHHSLPFPYSLQENNFCSKFLLSYLLRYYTEPSTKSLFALGGPILNIRADSNKGSVGFCCIITTLPPKKTLWLKRLSFISPVILTVTYVGCPQLVGSSLGHTHSCLCAQLPSGLREAGWSRTASFGTVHLFISASHGLTCSCRLALACSHGYWAGIYENRQKYTRLTEVHPQSWHTLTSTSFCRPKQVTEHPRLKRWGSKLYLLMGRTLESQPRGGRYCEGKNGSHFCNLPESHQKKESPEWNQ